MDKALNYLALARKAGLIELGEEPVGAAARAQHARLIVVAEDAGDHTWRRAKSFVAGTNQLCIRISASKDDMGRVTGRTSLALAAITDPALALAFLKAMPQPERYTRELQTLEESAKRVQQRRREAKAHERKARKGKK